MADHVEDRYVVRLSCGHEALEVVPVAESATPVGAWFTCDECRRRQPVIESFRVDP
jgi:hypothetical protein